MAEFVPVLETFHCSIVQRILGVNLPLVTPWVPEWTPALHACVVTKHWRCMAVAALMALSKKAAIQGDLATHIMKFVFVA